MDEFILTKNYLEKIKGSEDFIMNLNDFFSFEDEHSFMKCGFEVYNSKILFRFEFYSGDDILFRRCLFRIFYSEDDILFRDIFIQDDILFRR